MSGLEKLLDRAAAITGQRNGKYLATIGVATIATEAFGYIFPNLLYDHVSNNDAALYTVMSKTVPFFLVNAASYWKTEQRNKVLFSEAVGVGITAGLGYILFTQALEHHWMPREFAPAVLHVAGAVSLATRAVIDRYNDVHRFGPHPLEFINRIKEYCTKKEQNLETSVDIEPSI